MANLSRHHNSFSEQEWRASIGLQLCLKHAKKGLGQPFRLLLFWMRAAWAIGLASCKPAQWGNRSIVDLDFKLMSVSAITYGKITIKNFNCLHDNHRLSTDL